MRRGIWRQLKGYSEKTWKPEGSPFQLSAEGLQVPISHEMQKGNITRESFSSEIANTLKKDIPVEQIEIKPDGMIYLPEIFYRKRLLDAFGPGGWCLLPKSDILLVEGYYIREYGLYCQGNFVSQAFGEESQSSIMGPSTAIESIKSQALMRCCKDIGIAADLWNPNYIRSFKSQYCISLPCEHAISKKQKVLWRKKSNPPFEYPWKEGGRGSSTSEEPFSLSSVVPAQLKRFKDKTWQEILNDPNGRSYLEWVSLNFDDASVIDLCSKALASSPPAPSRSDMHKS